MPYDPRDYEIRIWYSAVPGDDCYIAQVVDGLASWRTAKRGKKRPGKSKWASKVRLK